METTILLVRHGETDWNLEQRVQGQSDRPLNETGRAQAAELAAELADEHLDAVYSSDLLRSLETARIVAATHGLPVTALAALRERDFGSWEGMTDTEVLARFPEAHHLPWGDAETPEEMAERVVAAIRRIHHAHTGGRVLVVAHGGPLRAVLRHCGFDGNGPIPNCHVIQLGVRRRTLRVLDRRARPAS